MIALRTCLKKCGGFGLIFLGQAAHANGDLSGFPLARTLETSRAQLSEREALLLEWGASRELGAPSDDDANPSTHPQADSREDVSALVFRAVARILRGQPVADVEAVLLDPTALPFARVGSSFSGNAYGLPCERRGDYDFAIMDWLALAYVARSHPGSIDPSAFDRLIRVLLPVFGPGPETRFELECLGRRLTLEDTENHILMVESARFLTNELLAERPEHAGDPTFDNASNGQRTWLLAHLQSFFIRYFEEYNSRPYQGVTVRPLFLLHDHARDEVVRRAAGLLLDLLSGVTSLQSNGLRRFPPFRRQPRYILPSALTETRGYLSWRGDGEAARLAFLAGNPVYVLENGGALPEVGQAFRAAISTHRLDDTLLSLGIEKAANPYFVAMHHANVEIYASSSRFLISAGGVFRPGVPPGVEGLGLPWPMQAIAEAIAARLADDQHGWARETVVIPSEESTADVHELVRFEGHRDLKKRNNTCVGPGFACGLSLRRPERRHEAFESCLSSVDGAWRFYDFTSSACALAYGGHMAVYERPCDGTACREASATGTFGLLEVADAPSQTADGFRSAVLAANPADFSDEGVQHYHTTTGHDISFQVVPRGDDVSILAVDENIYGPKARGLPLARGDALSATTPGRVVFESRSQNTRLILDHTRVEDPRRLVGPRPSLVSSSILGGTDGVFFDDSESVLHGDSLEWIELCGDDTRVGYRARHRSTGLEVGHGDTRHCVRLTMEEGERLVSVGIGLRARRLLTRVGALSLETNRGRRIQRGSAPITDVLRPPEGWNVVALRGRDDGRLTAVGAAYARDPCGEVDAREPCFRAR